MNGKDYGLVSLFSGAGGMDLGFKLNENFHFLLANDILSPPAYSYSENFRHSIINLDKIKIDEIKEPTYLVGDISDVNFDLIDRKSVDVIVGGPPCQDFSIVRGPKTERQGIDVRRGRLYSHFIRSLIHLQPKIFVFENVPGLKSANKGTAYETISNDFTKLNVRWDEIKKIAENNFSDSIKNYQIIFSDIVDSSNVGVPQKRRRLIILGVREDIAKKRQIPKIKSFADKKLSGKDSLLWNYPLTPIEAFEGLPLNELADKYNGIMKEYEGVAKAVKTERSSKWNKETWGYLSFDILNDYCTVNGIQTRKEKELKQALAEHVAILKKLGYYKKSLKNRSFSDGSNEVSAESKNVTDRMQMIPPDENHEFVRGTKWQVEGRGMSLIYRRIHPLKPSYTVVAHGGGGTWGYHYERARGKLTNRERARLQSFPDWFLFKGSGSKIRAQIGEAVPPLLGERLASITKMVLQDA